MKRFVIAIAAVLTAAGLAAAGAVPASSAPTKPRRPETGPTASETARAAIAYQPSIRWGGRAVAATVDPSNASTAIVASESGGLFKTVNDGVDWQHLDSFPLFRMNDVRYLADGSVIALATDTHVVSQAGIYVSFDGGSTWTRSFNQCAGDAWSVDQGADGRVYVAGDCGIQVSADSGKAFGRYSKAPLYSVAAMPSAGAYVCGPSGVQRFDGTNLTSPVAPGGQGCVSNAARQVAIDPQDQRAVFVVNAVPKGLTSTATLWASGNAGISWTDFSTTETARAPFVVAHASRDGKGNHLDVYYGGIVLREATCTSLLPGLSCPSFPGFGTIATSHDDKQMVAFTTAAGSECAAYLATDGGIEQSSDCGSSFHTVGSGIHGYDALQIYDMAGQALPSTTDLYFATQDNSLWASSDSGGTWPHSTGAEGFFLQVPQSGTTASQVTFVGCDPCSNQKSTPLFGSVSAWNNPPGGGGNPFLVNAPTYLQWSPPSSGSTSIALWLTRNAGGSWTQVHGSTVTAGQAGVPQIVGPTSNPTVYQGLLGASGTTIERLSGLLSGTVTTSPASTGISVDSSCDGVGSFVCLPAYAADPFFPGHLIAADDLSGEIMESTDYGHTWNSDAAATAQVTENGTLSLAGQVHTIFFDPTAPGRILIGTEQSGIAATIDGGAHWFHVTGSEQIPAITDFYDDQIRGKIYVASYGRGLWKIALPEWAYAWSDYPNTSSYIPATDDQQDSVGTTANGQRTAVGQYLIDFPRLPGPGGVAEVSAQGTDHHSCELASRTSFSGGQRLSVACFDAAGHPADTTFTADYVQPAGIPDGAFGYALDTSPSAASFTPFTSSAYDTAAGPVTISRSATGTYSVLMPGLGTSGGTVKVSAVGTNATHCGVGTWHASGADLIIPVTCATPAGAAADSQFSVRFAARTGLLGTAGRPSGYVTGNQPSTVSYTPDPARSYDSVGGVNTIHRSGVGQYTVTMPGLIGSNGTVQVSAVGNSADTCEVVRWASDTIDLQCSNAAGNLTDVAFTAQYGR